MALDLLVLASTVVSKFLLPYLAKGADKVGEAVTEHASKAAAQHVIDVSESLWRRVKAVFTGDRERWAIEEFQLDPETFTKMVEKILAEKLAADPSLASELDALVTSPSPDGSGSGIEIVQASTVGIVDARHAHIEGGYTIGVMLGQPPPVDQRPVDGGPSAP